MGRPGFTVLAVLLALGGCAQENPLFGHTAGQSGGVDGDGTAAGGDDDDDDDVSTSGTDAPADGDSTAAGMSASATGSSDGMSPEACGNGRLDLEEECDDDREFCIDCKELGRIDWLTSFTQRGVFNDRFAGVVITGDRIAAVGRSRTMGDPDVFGVVVVMGRAEGNVIGEPTLLTASPLGTQYFGSDFFGAALDGDTLYVVGAVDDTSGAGGYDAAVLVYDVASPPEVIGIYDGLTGNVGRAVVHDGARLGVALANWLQGAYGTAEIPTDGSQPEFWLTMPAPDQDAAAVTVAGGDIIVGGMSEGRPFIATAQGTFPAQHWNLVDVEFEGAVQGMYPLSGDVVVAGYSGTLARAPWAGRYRSDGSQAWSWVGKPGGPAEELETVTMDGEGRLVFVGHIGDPTHGIVKTFEPDGSPGVRRIYDELGDGTRFRDVKYSPEDGALYIVGEIPGPSDDDAFAMRVRWDF